MALLVFDGFDTYTDYNTMRYNKAWGGSPNHYISECVITTGIDDSLSNNNQALRIYRPHPTLRFHTDSDTIIIGFNIYLDYTSSNNGYVQIRNSENIILWSIRTMTYGDMELRGGDGNRIGSPFNIGVYKWRYVELKIKSHATLGTAELHLDGHTIFSLTNQDTTHSTATNHIPRGAVLFNAELVYTYYDNFYVCDDSGSTHNDFLGVCTVLPLKATGDSGTPDFTRSAGSNNYENVDEYNPDNATTYNYSSTAGDKDLFTYEDLPTEIETVYGVQLDLTYYTSDKWRPIKGHVNSGANTNDSGDLICHSSWFYAAGQYTLPFVTGTTEWTPTTVNAIVAGYEVSA